MEKLCLLFLFFHISSPVKHSLKFFATGSSGITNLPEFLMTIKFDDTVVGYCDIIKKKAEPRHDLMKQFVEKDRDHLKKWEEMCFRDEPNFLIATINSLMPLSNHTGGFYTLQMICYSEWDDETDKVHSFIKYHYDGKDVITFNQKTNTWEAPEAKHATITESWNAEGAVMKTDAIYYTHLLPKLVGEFVALTKKSQQIKEPPSVFLLQQTPSSPVRCFASGFYPERASLFWRKDGDDLHEDVEHGEILPNNDETFQMSVDLKVSSVKPEDWRRYECVFQLSGVKDDIITKLDKTAIRTNWEEPSHMTVPIVASVAVLVLIFIAAVGFIIYRRRKKVKAPQPSPELSEQLNQRPECQTQETSLFKPDDEVNT